MAITGSTMDDRTVPAAAEDGPNVRRGFRRLSWRGEGALFVLALLVYELSRALVIGDPSRAFSNAQNLIGWEKAKGIFVETDVQDFFFNYPSVIKALNYFYIYAHWIVTVAFFVWMYQKRPRWYPYVRNAFFAANGIALIVFMLFPVAPPRLISGTFVDTLRTISGIDLHGGRLSHFFNPYAAVPSMHFGYALMIGVVAALLLHNWPLRAIALADPAVVFFAIVGTANHYIVDSFGGAIAVLLGFAIAATWFRCAQKPSLAAQRR